MTNTKFAIIGTQDCIDIFNANKKLNLGLIGDEEEVAKQLCTYKKKDLIEKLKQIAEEKETVIGGIDWDKSEDRFGVYWCILYREYLSAPIDEDESPYRAFDGVDLAPYLKMADSKGDACIRSSKAPKGKILN